MIPFSDCVLGFHFGHSGGLPGYGSNVLFLPERGVAVFAFTNRTYARVSLAVREAANTLAQSGAFPARLTPLSPALNDIARAVERMYKAGDVLAARERLAANVLLDQGVAPRNARLAELRKKLGDCSLTDRHQAETSMSATLAFACEKGPLHVKVVLAPTTPSTLQTLEFAP